MARPRDHGQVVEEDRAADNQILAWERVRKHALRAGTVHISAVISCSPGRGAAALRSNGSQTRSHITTRGRRGRLEVLLELLGAARLGRRGRSRSQLAAVTEGAGQAPEAAGAACIALELGTLDACESALDLGSLCAVDGDLELVAREDESLACDEIRGVALGVGNRAEGGDLEGAAAGEVVHSRDIDVELDAGACCERRECICWEICQRNLLAHAREGRGIAFPLVSKILWVESQRGSLYHQC